MVARSQNKTVPTDGDVAAFIASIPFPDPA